eukprot:5925750-Prymnesium_polylepis.2
MAPRSLASCHRGRCRPPRCAAHSRGTRPGEGGPHAADGPETATKGAARRRDRMLALLQALLRVRLRARLRRGRLLLTCHPCRCPQSRRHSTGRCRGRATG